MDGGCRCGGLRFRISGPALMTSACHCTGCQRMTGGPYSLSTLMPKDAFEVLSGTPVRGGLHGDIEHMFCQDCMSWVFTRVPAYGIVNVRSTMLDDTSGSVPFMETYTSERLAWVTTPARHSFEKFPDHDTYTALIAAFAERTR